MAYKPENPESITTQEDLLSDILRELKKIVIILNEGHDLEIDNGDIE